MKKAILEFIGRFGVFLTVAVMINQSDWYQNSLINISLLNLSCITIGLTLFIIWVCLPFLDLYLRMQKPQPQRKILTISTSSYKGRDKIHYAQPNKGKIVYACNWAINANKNRITYDKSKITCQNCRRIIEKGYDNKHIPGTLKRGPVK